MEVLHVTYRIAAPLEEAEARGEEIAREQTVEVPRSVVRDAFVRDEILGRVDAVSADPQGGSRVRIAYPVASTAHDPSQLLNVLFGNISLQGDVALEELELPPSLLGGLRGPRFGLAGLREITGVSGRPLTCAVAKPMGLSAPRLASLVGTFAEAGIDVIKDDHGLADHPFCTFEERVTACQAAVEEVAQRTGRLALYAPNLNGTPATVLRQLRTAETRGVRAVMIAPMLAGLPFFWELCQQHTSVPVLAHPAFAGVQRIACETLLGRIFRVFGADAVIFPHSAGRFGFSADTCRRLAEALRCPWEPIRPVLPVPGGGIQTDRVAEAVDFYGPDCMLLIGGSLLEAGDALGERSRRFADEVRQTVAA